MQIWNWKKNIQKSPKQRFWERLGLHLGRVWDGLGPLLGTLGRLLAVLGLFKIEFFSNIGPRCAPRGFWIDFGWISEDIWKDLGRFWETFRISKMKLLGHSCTLLGANRSLFWCLFGILVGVPWASLGSLGQLSRDFTLSGTDF